MRDRRFAASADDDEWESAQRSKALGVIWPLLGRHIAFHRRLVDLTASVKAALLLSQTIYWTRHGRGIAGTGGWFFKSTEQWEMETGLSAKEQATAREVLRKLAVLSEQRSGIPARLHFRLCVDQLGALLGDRIGRASGRLDWADGAAVAELLGPSLAYHRSLAGIGGGVHAGLLLSRALHLTRMQKRRQVQEWICNSAAEWTEQIGLTRREQETARRQLARAGIWEEAFAGMPPRLLARIRLDCLLALLAGDANGLNTRHSASCLPECGVPATSLSQNGETRLRDSHILVLPKAPYQFRRNRHHCYAESAILLIQGSTRDSVQQPQTPDASPADGCPQGGGDLILPEALLPEERAAALLLVQRCADHAQQLLDELSARMQAKAVHTSPIAYLRGLVRRALAGEFVPELGQRVTALRRLRQEELLLRQQREAEEQRLAAECAAPEHQAKLASRRTELRQIVGAMQAGRPSEKRS